MGRAKEALFPVKTKQDMGTYGGGYKRISSSLAQLWIVKCDLKPSISDRTLRNKTDVRPGLFPLDQDGAPLKSSP